MASVYREAARVYAEVESGRSSLKKAAFASKSPQKCVALVAETLKRRDALAYAIKKCKVRAGDQRRDACMLMLATYDAVAGKGLPKGGGVLLRAVREKLDALKAAYHEKWVEPEPVAEEDLLPRYIRCNPLRGASRESVRAALRDEYGADDDFEASVVDDAVVADLLCLPRSWAKRVHGGHDLVISGRVVLQDKASCFSAAALFEDVPLEWRGDVLDACAAPGNKTTHAAALLAGRGAVVALDRDARRLALLRKRVDQAGGAKIVEARLDDFLTVDAASVPNVRAILLDPSCSGSGMVGQGPERAAAEGEADAAARLESLAAFQREALGHALSDFPNVDRVVYSTCSVHDVENEDVVSRALATHRGEFRVEPCLRGWARRGRAHAGLTAAESACLVRADAREDRTNGFFVALFVRISATSNKRKAAPDGGDDDDGDAPTATARNLRRKLKRQKAKLRAAPGPSL
ncbi:S-adenosyl-L-methionine-dependent methyltransferase [Pelagophyceae sp. CCMP2097]|nr:S-adenosyl-L-methionine-dependent methyltransferase [Pelagophyceae sp. CCMP2097]